ncbi:MAG: hypothetical protein JSV36_06405, partial [Anaerolineae bacterium]
EGSVSSVAASAGAETVAVGTRAGHVYIFDSHGEPIYHHVARKSVRDVAISADGRVAVAASEDGHVYGFLLPVRAAVSAPLEEGSPPATTKYHIHIERGEGIVIGDRSQVVITSAGDQASQNDDEQT